ncbi:MAG: hypothetical protein IJH92_05835, partial [Mogibacterium sp.]|nr:hypothetical protein [Mogibacterium sp.]
ASDAVNRRRELQLLRASVGDLDPPLTFEDGTRRLRKLRGGGHLASVILTFDVLQANYAIPRPLPPVNKILIITIVNLKRESIVGFRAFLVCFFLLPAFTLSVWITDSYDQILKSTTDEDIPRI